MKTFLGFTTVIITMLSFAVLPALVMGGADKPAGTDPLASLERFIGHWTVDGKWSDGNELHARAVYEWGVGKKIITAKTFVKDKDKEYQRYESIFAWHPKKKSLYEITFSFEGAISEAIIDNKDKDTLLIGYTPFDKDQPATIRQSLHFKDNDTFTWIVLLKDGETWKKIMEADWKRQAK
ncbi:MAG: hypothetical protein ACJ8FY_10710 [Gemmataceae bacterium]